MVRYLSISGDTTEASRIASFSDGRRVIYDLQDGSLVTGRPTGTLSYRKKDYLVYSAEALLEELECHDSGLPLVIWPQSIPDHVNPEAME